MALTYRAKVVKYVLLCLNSFLFFLGLSGIVTCYCTNRNKEVVFENINKLNPTDNQFRDYRLTASAYLLVSSTLIMLTLTILGYCGTLKELKFLLVVYVFSMAFILAIELSAFLLNVITMSTIEYSMKDTLENIIKNATLNNTLKEQIKMFQNLTKCCAISHRDKEVNSTAKCDLYTQDCYEKISYILTENDAVVSTFSFIIFTIQCVLMILAYVFISSISIHQQH
ncbi:tetraspanin-8 [Octopus bimaculoides]|nr:tetraspanin-8 [Octopus bimaculoides]|eukprot:XP_014788811.1 PREDICTED: tetraspanin-8-like [Octopus bimaculoides]